MYFSAFHDIIHTLLLENLSLILNFRRCMMKVLIIEDNDSKLEDAIRILDSHGITERVHVNNYMEAYRLCFRNNILDDIDFIILDIQFYKYRPLIGERQLPDQHAGYKFLMQLAEKEKTVPVFVFSSVDDYQKEYNEFLFPSFSEYRAASPSPSFIISRLDSERQKYDSQMAKNKEILEKTSFVLGQAHNDYELARLIAEYLANNNKL